MAKTDRYLNQLEDTAISILKRVGNTGAITETDIALLNIYKKEIRATDPKFSLESLISNIKKVVNMINKNLEDK